MFLKPFFGLFLYFPPLATSLNNKIETLALGAKGQTSQTNELYTCSNNLGLGGVRGCRGEVIPVYFRSAECPSCLAGMPGPQIRFKALLSIKALWSNRAVCGYENNRESQTSGGHIHTVTET